MTNETTRPLKVFLCHASGDKPAVRDLYKRLIAEGVDAWLDEEKLLPGQDWNDEILRALQESDAIIICLSKTSVSKEGYVQREIKEALEKAKEKPSGTIFVIPSKLDDCEIPNYLRQWQWVDLFAENGHERLMRSLKLRADRVGATIEPSGYESEDKETERRLDQLYTEGLAAFYTEDWDRAHQRFQSILRERPNHKNAADKLTQAERQRNFVKLYTQATEAYGSENWPSAIQALEELLEKSGDYKDTAHLLKEAKKQKQLRELYAEAKRLHTGQEWQAVIRVFDQITGIDSAFPDPEGLLLSAQKEASELKRLADLHDLYSQGVHKMDAGEWYEARSLLEQVHKAQTGFLDTELLLRKVENEILKIEEARKRDAQVLMLYEQARKMARAGQWSKALAQMEEIRKLNNQFVDSDGILEKAKAGVAREEQEAQQRRELAELYGEAVSLLEAKKYQEALEKWNAIQAIDPKYKDTARVKTIARRKLDEISRPEAVDQPWMKVITDWLRLETNIPMNHQILTEKLLLLSFAVVAIIRILWTILPNSLNWQSNPLLSFVYWAPLGGLFGTVVAFALSKVMLNWQLKHSLTLIVGWALGLGASFILFTAQYLAEEGAFIIYRLLPGFATVAAIKWARPTTRPISLILIFASWILASMGGRILGLHLINIFNIEYTFAIVDALVILLGLLFTFGMQIEGMWEVLKTGVFGALGFAIGGYVAGTIGDLWLLPEISYSVWGLIGGAILASPSRDSRRILLTAAMCGIGLLVGSYVAFDILPLIKGQYANIAFSQSYFMLRQPFLGIGLGLALGLLIRQASTIGVLAVLGGGMYMITFAMNAGVLQLSPSEENIVRGAMVGLVLGYGYGYMRKAKPLQSTQRVTKTKWVWAAVIGLVVISIPVVIWLSSPLPFTSSRWDFGSSTEDWGEYHHLSSPQIRDGSLTFRSTGIDPSFESPTSLIPASDTPVITVRMRIGEGQGTRGQIFFLTDQDGNWDETKSVLFTLLPGPIFRTYNILMSENPAWRGTITKIRIDPVDDPSGTNIEFAIDYISVHAP